MSHIDRMQVELRELTDKAQALADFIDGGHIFASLSSRQRELMEQQLDVMKAYKAILTARIDHELDIE